VRRDEPGPFSLDALAAVPRPQVFTTDGEAWRQRLVTWFEAASGRKLYPMQVEMLLIETLAYAMGVLGSEAQLTAEQHLVAFADEVGLEQLAANRSTTRLPAAKARTTLSVTIPLARTYATIVPEGSRVRAGDGGPVFLTLNPAVIPAGLVTATVTAEAEIAGAAANGLLPGQITTLMDPVPGVTISNTTASAGGADQEAIELFRLRLANAFERISVGGSRAWYVETTMGVSAAIVDVAVIRPQPCYVDIYPLTFDGAASLELRQQVAAVFNRDDALDERFGDEVTVKVADIQADPCMVAIRVDGPLPSAVAAVQAKVDAVCLAWRRRFGARIAPSDIEAAARSVDGVVDAQVSGLAYQRMTGASVLNVTVTVTAEAA